MSQQTVDGVAPPKRRRGRWLPRFGSFRARLMVLLALAVSVPALLTCLILGLRLDNQARTLFANTVSASVAYGSSANPITIVMSADKTCTATFTLGLHTLTVASTGTGTGTITSSPSTPAGGTAFTSATTSRRRAARSCWAERICTPARPAPSMMPARSRPPRRPGAGACLDMELRRGNRSLNNRRFVLTRDRVISRSRGIV